MRPRRLTDMAGSATAKMSRFVPGQVTERLSLPKLWSRLNARRMVRHELSAAVRNSDLGGYHIEWFNCLIIGGYVVKHESFTVQQK